MDFMQLVKDFGVPLALVIFFVLKGDRREAKMGERLGVLEDFIKTSLLGMVKESTEVMKGNSVAIDLNTKALTVLTGKVDVGERMVAGRPCLLERDAVIEWLEKNVNRQLPT